MPTERRLVLGPFRSLKARLLVDIARIKQADALAPVIVLVGSNLLGIELRRALAARTGGHINVRFLTFRDLAAALGQEALLSRGLAPLPLHGDELLAGNLAAKIPERSYFGRVAPGPRFARSLLRTISDLREGGFDRWPLTAAQTRAIAASAHCEPDKLAQLARLFDEYCGQLSARFFDMPSLLSAAAANAATFGDTFGTGRLFVYGLYDVNAAQRGLIAACANSVDVTAYVPVASGPAKQFEQPTLDWFALLGFGAEAIPPDGPARSDLERLQRHLFAELPAGRDTSDQSVELVSAPGEVREVRELARRVLGLAHQGVPFHRIGILLRHPDVYGPLFADLFERLGIPHYMRHGPSVASTPAGRSARMLLGLVGSEMRRFEVMELLCYADVRAAELTGCAEPTPPSQWDRLSRQAGIAGGPDQWDQRLQALAEQLTQQLSDEPEGAPPREIIESDLRAIGQLRGFLKVFFAQLNSVPERAKWSEFAGLTVNLLGRVIRVDSPELLDTLRGLAALDAVEGEVEFEAFRNAAIGALEAAELPRGKFGRDGVCICDLLASRGLEFDVVIVPGLVEKSFPAPARQDPILLDAERDLLNRVAGGGRYAVLSQRQAEEEAIFLALAVGAASRRVILSFPRIDAAAGRERIPSSFVLRIGEALAGRRIDYGDIERLPWCMRVDLSQMVPREAELAIDAAEYDLSTADRAAAGSGRVGHLRSEYASLDRAACADEMRWGRRELTAYDGLILPPRTGLSLAAPKTVSPTRLEEYARCPYRYFLHHVLGLVIEQDAAELDRISPIERGALAHRVLERFFRAQQQKSRLPLDAGQRDMLLDELRGFLNHEAEAAERRGVVGYPLTWRIDRERLLDDLIAALDHEMDRPRDLVPECFELRFGSDGDVGFETTAGRRIAFRGRIDRLDTCAGEQRARVIDYKTGRGGYKDDTFEGGQRLQLPVYLLAARAMRGYPMQNLVAEYCMVNRESSKPAVFRGQTLQEREGDFRVILLAIADGVESGLFPAWPAPTADCSRCDYRRVCGRVAAMAMERKLNDPRLEGLHRMRAINGKD